MRSDRVLAAAAAVALLITGVLLLQDGAAAPPRDAATAPAGTAALARTIAAPPPTREEVGAAPAIGAHDVADAPTTAFRGRVVDENGAGVSPARVLAYRVRDGRPVDGALACAATDNDGTWRLAAPAEDSLWLLAVPLRFSLFTQPAAVAVPGEPIDSRLAGEEISRELLPAAATIAAGAVVPDIVVPPAAIVHGRVHWQGGEPIAGACVEALPHGGVRFAFSHGRFVQLHEDGQLSPSCWARTDEQGAFELAVAPDAHVMAHVLELGPAGELAGELPQQAADPRTELCFAVPRPVLLRVSCDGAPLRHFLVDVDDGVVSTRSGLRAVIAAAPLRLRAGTGRRRSQWCTIGPADSGKTVDLEATNELTPVAISFVCESRWQQISEATLTWHRTDGAHARERLRAFGDGMMTLFLERGHYRLTAGTTDAQFADHDAAAFLLPIEREVDVGSEPIALQLPATYGGRFRVIATDRAGRCIAGRCRVIGDGCDPSPRFTIGGDPGLRRGAPGELLAGAPNLVACALPGGVYEVVLEFPGCDDQRRTVAIEPWGITDVRVRL